MKNIAVLDHETYYDQEYSLSKMMTEDYITDERFQSMLVSVKINDDPVIWTSGSTQHITQWLLDHEIDKMGVVCHNHMFDGMVNLVHHGFVPKALFCTRFMAKAIIQPFTRSVSLDQCLKYIDAPVRKLGYLSHMKGRRRETLSQSELRDYAEYCSVDTEGTYHLFRWLAERLPREEYSIIDMTLRMYLEPQLIADASTFKQVFQNEQQKKIDLLNKLPEDVIRADLMSNVKFAQVLQNHGIDPPTKISPTTGKVTWAFAKNDPGWKDLEDECADDPIVAPILAARLGTKSTIAETRAERLWEIGRKHKYFRVPLVYYSAHTGRYGGTEKINAQNLTRIDPKNPSRAQLRYGIQAPEGYSIIAPDLSQIEARLNAWMAGCSALLELFATGQRVYSAFASRLFNTQVTKATHPKEDFIGKTCILGLGYGMGANKLRATLRKDDLIVDDIESQRYVDVYRSEYREIPAMWRFCDAAIDVLCNGGKIRIGPCMASRGKITLPNGMQLDYPNIKYVQEKKYDGWTYTYAGRVRTLWGGKIVENIIQALARIKITDAMRDIRAQCGLRPVLQAHDELVYVVPSLKAQYYLDRTTQIMSTAPAWAPNLPLEAEGGIGQTYGDCK